MKRIKSRLVTGTLAIALGSAPLSSAIGGGEVLPALIGELPNIFVGQAAPPPLPPVVGAAPASTGVPEEVLLIAAAAAAFGLFIAIAASDESGRDEPVSPS